MRQATYHTPSGHVRWVVCRWLFLCYKHCPRETVGQNGLADAINAILTNRLTIHQRNIP